MERKIIGDQIAEEVTGGSIVFSTDHTTCGYNCNNQCKVNDYDAAMEYIRTNYDNKTEKDIMNDLLSQGLISML